MRRAISTVFIVSLFALGACSSLGQRVTLDLAELTTRCEDRGGVLIPTGAETGRPQSDYICREAMVGGPGLGNAARTSLNRAVDVSLQRGY